MANHSKGLALPVGRNFCARHRPDTHWPEVGSGIRTPRTDKLIPMKIIIIDDHSIVRQGIRLMLEDQAELQVVGESSTGLDTLALCQALQPDLILLDLSLGSLNGMDLIKKVTRDHPQVRILVFSAFEEASYAVRALKAGASGYVSKEQAAEELLSAIRTVLTGKKYITAAVAQSLADWVQDSDLSPAHIQLTSREFETVQLIAAGLTTSEIGDRLCISVKTVGMYRQRVLFKLGLRNNAELIAYVINNHLTLAQSISQETDLPD